MALLRALSPGTSPAAPAKTFRDQGQVKGGDLSATQAPDRHLRPTTGSDSMHLVVCLVLKRYDASKT
jgi:hypothetical protein